MDFHVFRVPGGNPPPPSGYAYCPTSGCTLLIVLPSYWPLCGMPLCGFPSDQADDAMSRVWHPAQVLSESQKPESGIRKGSKGIPWHRIGPKKGDMGERATGGVRAGGVKSLGPLPSTPTPTENCYPALREDKRKLRFAHSRSSGGSTPEILVPPMGGPLGPWGATGGPVGSRMPELASDVWNDIGCLTPGVCTRGRMPGLTSDAWIDHRMPGLTSDACDTVGCL